MTTRVRRFFSFTSLISVCAFWFLNSASVILLLPPEIFLPDRIYYAVSLLLPSPAGCLVGLGLAAGRFRRRLAAALATAAATLAVLWLQSRLLQAFALQLEPSSEQGGMLSNALVTGHAFVAPLSLSVLIGSVLIALLALIGVGYEREQAEA